jgi:hypothetical protein
MFKFISITKPQLPQTCDRERCVHFATWIQDNYSPNKKQDSSHPLPKGKYRKDFTDEIYTISELYSIFNAV